MLRAIIFFSVVSISVFLIACGGAAPANNATANNMATAGNSNNPLQTNAATPEATTNNAPTLTPVFKAYCEAMVQKNEAALRRIYSSDTIKNFEEQMKKDNIKTLLKFLEDDKVSGKLCEVRNEQITGDTAVAEIRADSYPNGIKVVFVKESGEWKLTNRSPALDSVKTSNSNSNSAK